MEIFINILEYFNKVFIHDTETDGNFGELRAGQCINAWEQG